MRDTTTNTELDAAKADRATAWDDREWDVDCPECDGQGHHDIRQFGRHVEDEYVSVRCSWCDGTGTARAERPVAS